MYTHGYNISLVDMVDKIASPLVKKFLTDITYKKLDSYPTPADYAHAVSTCAHAAFFEPARSPAAPVLHSCMSHERGARFLRQLADPSAWVAGWAAVPKLKALWATYYKAYDVDVIVVPTLPTTARPIDDVEPYMTFNGRKVHACLHAAVLPSAARQR
jgi:hypothetical protein